MTTSFEPNATPSERDPAFDAAWRTHSGEAPPAALDAAILAAAHRAVGAAPKRAEVREATRPERWWWPLAAAATIGAVTIGILQLMPQDRGGVPDAERGIVSDMPPAAARSTAREAPAASTPPAAAPTPPAADASAPSPAPVATPAPAQAVAPTFVPSPAPAPMAAPAAPRERRSASRDEPQASGGAMAKREADAAPAAVPPAKPATPAFVPEPAPNATLAAAPPPAPAPPLAPSTTGAPAPQSRIAARAPAAAPAPSSLAQPFPGGGAGAQRAAENAAAPARAVGKLAAEADAPARADLRKQQRAPLPVNEWIALIRKLRHDGMVRAAEKELADFRAAHADHERLLPADLQAWRPAEK